VAETWALKAFFVELSPRALRDLEQVKRDVFSASQSETITFEYLRRIAAEINSLEHMPLRFPFWKESQSYRFLVAGKYLVFFKVAGSVVQVMHVRYAGGKPFRG